AQKRYIELVFNGPDSVRKVAELDFFLGRAGFRIQDRQPAVQIFTAGVLDCEGADHETHRIERRQSPDKSSDRILFLHVELLVDPVNLLIETAADIEISVRAHDGTGKQ